MTLEELIAQMGPEQHEQMRRAIELGKWPDGRKLSDEDKAFCMQAVIAYEAKNLSEEERVGYMDESNKGCLPDWLKPDPIKWS